MWLRVLSLENWIDLLCGEQDALVTWHVEGNLFPQRLMVKWAHLLPPILTSEIDSRILFLSVSTLSHLMMNLHIRYQAETGHLLTHWVTFLSLDCVVLA